MTDRPNEFSVGTWNIGGGILGESHQKGAGAQLDYHVARVLEWCPEILCIQEAHEFHDSRRGQAAEIAEGVGAVWRMTSRISQSHLDPGADLSLSILSQRRLRDLGYVRFPNPGLDSVGPNGDHWSMFDKGYQVAEAEVPGGVVRIVNAHCYPFHYFGVRATDPRFSSLWDGFADELLALAESGPTIMSIDLNFEPISGVLGKIFKDGIFKNTFTATPTTPKGVQQDYIVYSGPGLDLLDASVARTKSDHYYGRADFRLTVH